ncbi:MAG: hypothetical protein J5849_00650, partial [Clostridia bacterium]|nr:hypothetical protein [Clostridia bacterium]
MTVKRGTAVLLGFLLLALCLAGLAPSAEAAGHVHDGGITFNPWNSTTTLPSGSGAYYLTGDVNLRSCWKTSGEVNLCLNGHTITQLEDGENVIEVSTGSKLCLYNCTGTGKIEGNGTAASVLVKGNFYMKSRSVEIRGNHGASGVEVREAGNFVLDDGVIVDNQTEGYGGGVYLATSTSNMQMNGGIIYDNLAEFGAGVAIQGGSFSMYGGEISDNRANERGGGVYVGLEGKFYMYGGRISENAATSTDSAGGGLYVAGKAWFMNGGEVSRNESGKMGGGISLIGGELEIRGALIENNTAPLGGGIYATYTFTLQDATVTGNHGYHMGGGIYLTGGNVKVSGRVKVMNNYLGDPDSFTECNLCFQTNMRKVEAIGDLDEDSKIGVYLETPTNENSALEFTSGLKSVGGITSPDSVLEADQRYEYGVTWNSGKTEAVIVRRPKITTQPTDVTAANGSTATFKVVATGASSYQWQYSADNGSTWHDTSFASNSATVSMEAISARNGLLFRCVVTNAAGTVTSSAARLTVSGVKPAIRTQPTAVTVANGKTATFKITAAGTGLSYQWQYSADNGNTWHNTSFASNSATVS